MRFHMTDRDSSPPSSGESPHAEGGCCRSQCSAQRPTRKSLSVCHLQIHIAPGSWASLLTSQLEMQICPGKYSSWANWVSFQKPLSSRRRPWRVTWVAPHKTQRYELWEIVLSEVPSCVCRHPSLQNKTQVCCVLQRKRLRLRPATALLTHGALN